MSSRLAKCRTWMVARSASCLMLAIGFTLLSGCGGRQDATHAGPQWRDPYRYESISSGRDDSRLVLLVERGIPLDANRVGGGIRLHRYTGSAGNRQTVWIALLSEFSGLKFRREARVAVVDDQVVVEVSYKNQVFAVDYNSGSNVRQIGPNDALVQTATDRGAWKDVKMLEPVRPTVEPQTGDTI